MRLFLSPAFIGRSLYRCLLIITGKINKHPRHLVMQSWWLKNVKVNSAHIWYMYSNVHEPSTLDKRTKFALSFAILALEFLDKRPKNKPVIECYLSHLRLCCEELIAAAASAVVQARQLSKWGLQLRRRRRVVYQWHFLLLLLACWTTGFANEPTSHRVVVSARFSG